ncbi:hypothetical protein Clacol_001476 [Clathrus columnatus]|uniref:Methylenetetrahydrofolate dehydrogenase n=1 Tax=Clathrus columnatus TaxID=1419009 RepID=A0AAV4ZYB8_9AGAM|nr:hypothetical protein Clacol_001476 [Clathrus columnatus]
MVSLSLGEGVLLSADSIALPFREEIQNSLRLLQDVPTLMGILSTNSKPSRFYAEFTKKTCEELGFKFILKQVGSALDPSLPDGENVEEAIIEANADPSIDGIMDQYLQQIVSPLKDVEGLHAKFHYNLYHNIRYIQPASLMLANVEVTESFTNDTPEEPPVGSVKSILPCTPLAIVKCLEHIGVYNKLLRYGDRAYGKIITVINRSEVVGRPLAALLANDGARVFSVDIDSIQEYTKRPAGPQSTQRYHLRHVVRQSTFTLEECLMQSDVVVSAVPSSNYKVETTKLKDGCICINVSSEKNFKKDIREKNVIDDLKVSLYVPSIDYDSKVITDI